MAAAGSPVELWRRVQILLCRSPQVDSTVNSVGISFLSREWRRRSCGGTAGQIPRMVSFISALNCSMDGCIHGAQARAVIELSMLANSRNSLPGSLRKSSSESRNLAERAEAAVLFAQEAYRLHFSGRNLPSVRAWWAAVCSKRASNPSSASAWPVTI